MIQLLTASRLLTLTGTGGAGKTRVALAVATSLCGAFADGVIFVPLAAVNDPGLVLPTIAHTLGLTETRDQFLALTQHLVQRHTLLILDNFEQVIAAAPQVAALLAACSRLHLLVTSREALRVASEQEYPIPPLALADRASPQGFEELVEVAAVALFVERAHAVNPAFQLTAATAPVVADICARLDGLPLAIELAAARIKLLAPSALLTRLDHPLTLLTGGGRDLPARQRTLRTTIDWSYRLLDAGEQRLFARMAVFADGCTLAAVAAVCETDGDLPFNTVDGVASLVDKSLVRAIADSDGETRVGMFETIREYARERLAEGEEHETIARAHATYFVELAEVAAPELSGASQVAWLARLERENDNLRTALRWTLDAGEIDTALRLVTALFRFWGIRGYLSEGRRWYEEVLPRTVGTETSARARALGHAGYLIRMQGDNDTARILSEECLAVAQSVGDTRRIAQALYNLALIAQYQGDYTTARALHSECLALHRDQGAMLDAAYCLSNLGEIAQHQGDYDAARTFLEESLALLRTIGGDYGIAYPLNDLGVVAREQGDVTAARAYLEESLTLRRAVNDKRGLAHTLHNLGLVARDEGDDGAARALHEEGLALQRELGDRQGIVRSLTSLGTLAVRAGDARTASAHYQESLTTALAIGDRLGVIENVESFAAQAGGSGDTLRAACLWGAAQAMRDGIAAPRPPAQRAAHERSVAVVRRTRDPERWATAWTEGQRMTVEQVVAYARETPPPHAIVPLMYPAGLSPREVEVLRLIAAGHTNREIANALFLSERTIDAHVRNIFTKTRTDNRAAATGFAYEHRLI